MTKHSSRKPTADATHGPGSPPSALLDNVVTVHAQEVASLYQTRRALRRSPDLTLHFLSGLDHRILAHLDGLAVAGEAAQRHLDAELEDPSPGAVFASVVCALERPPATHRDRIWALVDAAPSLRSARRDAMGWVEPRRLQGLVRDLLQDADPERRVDGLTACAMHRTDAKLESGPWIEDAVPAVRARAHRAAGELGLTSLAPRCVAATRDDDEDCRFWASWSAVLMGDRRAGLDSLTSVAVAPTSPHRARAFRLALQATDLTAAHAVLERLARDPAQLRWLVEGSGLVGDVTYVPWLIGHMSKPETARLAGESFTLITGANLDALQLWQQRPEDVTAGPTEEPDDDNVELDPDEGLMWPDVKKVENWWAANADRFPKGRRHFMGEPVTRARCVDVLKNGYQRQRVLAAHHLCLIESGTPLFNTSAPVWRQQRQLATLR